MIRNFIDLVREIKNVVGISPWSTVGILLRLLWVVKRKPRDTESRFRFPFGEIQYVDGPSLKSQYLEIFVRKIYDFQVEHEDPTIIDCGGNVGLSVIWFKQRYPKSRITVFEADPAIGEVLRANLEALDLTDVQINNAAAWNKTGQVGFVGDGADSGRIDPQSGRELVNTVRLADEITQPIDLLKLDVEGAEYAIIQDLCETGKINHIKQLICEIHGRRGDKEAFANLVKGLADHRFTFTFGHLRFAPDLPGEPEMTPFSSVPDGKYLMHLYAWQPGFFN